MSGIFEAATAILNVSNKPRAIRRRKAALMAYAGLISFLGIACITTWVCGWRPESPINMPPFGASAAQCKAAFSRLVDTGSNMEHLHRWSQLFYTKGWSIIVSYDDQHRAEQFIFCKTQLPFTRSPPMNAAEQKDLLEKFKAGSSWSPSTDVNTGPVWTRDDGQAYAFYMHDQRWMILVNKAGMDRNLRALNLKMVE